MQHVMQLGLLSLAGFTHFVSWYSVAPYISLVVKQGGASPGTIGLLMAAPSMLSFLVAIPSGLACDRIGARLILVISSVGLLVAHLLLLSCPSLGVMAAILLFNGLFQLLFTLSAQVVAARMGDETMAYKRFAIFSFCCSLGQFSGPLVGGLLAKQLGYRATFGCAAILAVPVVPCSLLIRESSRSKAGQAGAAVRIEGRKPWLRQALHLTRQPALLMGIAAIFGVVLISSMRTSFYPLYFDEVGLDAPAIGLLLLAQGVADALSRPWLSAFVSRLGTIPTLLCALATGALSAALVPLMSSFWALVPAMMLSGVGMGLAQPLSLTLVNQAAEESGRGLAMGLRMAANRSAGLLSPLCLGAVGERWGIGSTFCGTALLISITAFFVYWLYRRNPTIDQSGKPRLDRAID